MNENRVRDIALQGVAMALAFAVGILLGARGCGPEPAEQPAEIQTVQQTCSPEVVYECPPDGGAPEVAEEKTGSPNVVGKPPKGKQLPDAPPPITPRERQRLLAWVRDQSADLDGCRSAAKETYRLTVTLELDDAGAVRRARFNAPPSELPSDVKGCLRDRMVRWKPPADFVKNRRELVFGLTL